MQKQKEITIVIELTGQSTIEAHNFVGTACKSATAPLFAAIGADPSDLETIDKPEIKQIAPMKTPPLKVKS